MFHAVVWLDHHSARIVHFDAEHLKSERIKASSHHTRQHGSSVRSEHEFLADVCEALADTPEILIVGSQQSQTFFRHYVQKHRPQLAPRVVGYESVDHPSEAQMVALARRFFLKYDRMAGVPGPTGT